MRRKLLHFLANNVFGLLALFVTLGGTAYAVNTVRSTDIVDGEVKSVDIGNGEILSADVKDQSLTTFDVSTFLGADVVDNTLTGDDVDESTLGRVPDAARVGGVDAAELRPGTAMGVQRTDSCYVTGQYGLCGTISITVPANTYYKVDVHSSMTAFGSTAGQGLFCAASRTSSSGPACLNNSPSGFTLVPGQYMNVSNSGTAYFSPGTYTFGMAARYDVAPAQNINTAFTTTTIRWHRYYAENTAAAGG